MTQRIVPPRTAAEFRVDPSPRAMRIKISTLPPNSGVVVTRLRVGADDRIVGSPEPVWAALDAICALEAHRAATIRVRNDGSQDAEVTVRVVPV